MTALPPRVWPLVALLLALSAAACLCACARQARSGVASPPVLPRADPGFMQWLERQSMLETARELAAHVSGTDLVWRSSAAAGRRATLLAAAPSWLHVNPHTVTAGRPALRALSRQEFLSFLKGAGFSGLYLAPTGETGDIWTEGAAAPVPSPPGEAPGDNVAALRPAASLGEEKDLAALVTALEQARIQMGGDLPPAATGLGPDFMLQARRASRFDGLYAMLPVPRTHWDILPPATGPWDCRPLDSDAVDRLRERDILPGPFWQDSLPWTGPGGWAATGEVRGADGQTRRWAYRYSGSTLRPVLLWQDPSAQAKRVLSAAAIRHTGLQRQALAGLRLAALMGLDSRPDAAVDGTVADAPTPQQILAPGFEALDTLAGEVRRYGGWTLQADALPPALTQALLDTAADFTCDAITPAATAHALLTGNTQALAALLQASLDAGVDHSRLARGLRAGAGTDWRALPGLTGRNAMERAAAPLAGRTAPNAWLPAALAARALHLTPDDAARPEHAAAMRSACLLLLGWRLGLPGLAFLSPADLAGALTPQAAVPLWKARGTTAGLAFGALEAQWGDPQSFVQDVARLLRARQAAGLAQGRLARIWRGPDGCLAALTALPDGGHWLLAANFSPKTQRMTCALSRAASPARALDGGKVDAAGHSLTVELAPRQARHILLGPATHP